MKVAFVTPAFQSPFDVLKYQVKIEPEIDSKNLKGEVKIDFRLSLAMDSIVLSAGNLEIEKIKGEQLKSFKRVGSELVVYLIDRQLDETSLTFSYSGFPKRGLYFGPQNRQAYTSYFTSHWMICNEDPKDKAKINLQIIVPKGLSCISNGELIDTKEKKGKTHYMWSQAYATPAYTYGFAIGSFQQIETSHNDTRITSYSVSHSEAELKKIFFKTPSIISFLEEKSGIRYNQATYSQLLIGDFYQEMSGFSILKEGYGELVLRDSTETNLISHELAHQWWGNRITCESWNHLWLNEAMATFMSAAYNEYRFGKEKYLADINSYLKVYQQIKSRSNDKPLVFDSWDNPTQDDRNLVYFKGAYVLHLLRLEVGDDEFWDGIRNYSNRHFDSTVNTKDFQQAMEETVGKSLDDFFNHWIYKQ